jgi:hypothetical protein
VGIVRLLLWGSLCAAHLFGGVHRSLGAATRGPAHKSRQSRCTNGGSCVCLICDVLAYWGGSGDELSMLTVRFCGVASPSAVGPRDGGLRGRTRTGKNQAACGCLVADSWRDAPIPVSLYLVTYVPHGILLTVLAALSVALTDVTITSTAQARPLNPLHLNASIRVFIPAVGSSLRRSAACVVGSCRCF